MSLLVFVVLGLAVCLTQAGNFIVVDVDGSVEDYATLVTILRHSTARSQLAFVSVNGNSWGSLKTTERNMKRFLALNGAATVPVVIGDTRTLSDAYNSTTCRGDCLQSQGIPKTPQEALRRGMKVSRFDVDRNFGAVTSLPDAAIDVLRSSRDSTTALMNLMGGLSTGERILYLSLSSLTNFATFLTKAKQIGLTSSVIASFSVHCYENGNNWALDPLATNIVLRQPSLEVTMYAPQLWKTSVTYSPYSWGLFERTAALATTSPGVKWLYAAWKKKKIHFDGLSNTATQFFKERGPASSLFTLCVIDTTVKAVCDKYKSANTTAMLVFSNNTVAVSSTPNPLDPSGSTTTLINYDAVSGNNVTAASFLQWPATTWSSNGKAVLLQDGACNVYVVDVSASMQWPGSSQKLVDVFWTRWTAILAQ